MYIDAHSFNLFVKIQHVNVHDYISSFQLWLNNFFTNNADNVTSATFLNTCLTLYLSLLVVWQHFKQSILKQLFVTTCIFHNVF